MAVFPMPDVSAAQTIPYKMNFQGRLTDNNGQPVADGSYNMKFRIFDASSGGSEQWSETRETTNRVTVANGLFSTQLGDVTTLPVSIFTTQNLYFEIELPTPATATCSTASCASFTEGAMTPRSKLGASAYAFNADTVDGIDGANIAKLDTVNDFSERALFNDGIEVYEGADTTFYANATSISMYSPTVEASTDMFAVWDASYNNVILRADAANMIVKIGTVAVGTLANVRLLSTSAEFTGTVRIGTSTNGVDISGSGVALSGTARPTRTITLVPEYPGAVLTADGGSNTGTMTSDFCSHSALLNVNSTACGTTGDEHNYYAWTTTQGTVQDYDIYIRYRMPADYDTGSMANMRIWGWGTTSANEIVSLALYKGSGTACSTITNAITGNTTWNEGTSASPLGACSIAAGDFVTFKVRVAAGTNNVARAGEIRFEYRSKF